ncbi:hypothetical protein CAEBREN_17377 [Caenorhabditis brenneri]|uniref:ETS domain-containing protein n=1 Tax=Caenorhabditis brenneri TaxID=135651 RepID=G0NF26_CAEBE|nr:hypothetical protein CAEBREN_17377 [Caenorhabditis brenneri]
MHKSCKDVPAKHRLLAFVRDVLEGGEHSDKVVWFNRDRSEFQFTDPHVFAGVYGRWINNPRLKFDDMCRSLREYTKKGIVEKVLGVESTWRFIEERKATTDAQDAAAEKLAELWKIVTAKQSF